MPELSTLGATIKTAYDGQAPSVLAFGVPTNGTTDATATLQAAINSGVPMLFFPPGLTLNVLGQIELVNNQILWGYGAKIIRIGESSAAYLLDAYLVNTYVYGFEFNGGRSTSTAYVGGGGGSVLNIEQSSALIKDVSIFDSMADGIRVGGTPEASVPVNNLVRMDNIRTERCLRSGVAATGFRRLILSNLSLFDTCGAGLDVELNLTAPPAEININNVLIGSLATNVALRRGVGVQRFDFGSAAPLLAGNISNVIVDDFWPAGTIDAAALTNGESSSVLCMNVVGGTSEAVTNISNVKIRSNYQAPAFASAVLITGNTSVTGLTIDMYGADGTGQNHACNVGLQVARTLGSTFKGVTIAGNIDDAVWIRDEGFGTKCVRFEADIDLTANAGGATYGLFNEGSDCILSGRVKGVAQAVTISGAASNRTTIRDLSINTCTTDIAFSGGASGAVIVDGFYSDVGGNLRTTGTSPANFVQSNINAQSGPAIAVYLFEEFEFPDDSTYSIIGYAPFPGTIATLKHFTISGTCTVAIKIGGVTVTGLSAVAVSSTLGSATATANNVVAVGSRVEVTFTNTVAGIATRVNLTLLFS